MPGCLLREVIDNRGPLRVGSSEKAWAPLLDGRLFGVARF